MRADDDGSIVPKGKQRTWNLAMQILIEVQATEVEISARPAIALPPGLTPTFCLRAGYSYADGRHVHTATPTRLPRWGPRQPAPQNIGVIPALMGDPQVDRERSKPRARESCRLHQTT